MSEKHSMIELYAENQVRFNEQGEKLISYDVSSYGYDLRTLRHYYKCNAVIARVGRRCDT